MSISACVRIGSCDYIVMDTLQGATKMGTFVHCECGTALGETCAWYGNPDDTVTVEYTPEYLRASHVAAGNRGVYPDNGAQHIRCERSCAERMVELDGDWCLILEDEPC